MIDKNDPKYSHYPHIGNSSQTPSDAPKNDEEQKANTDTTIEQNPVETNSERNTEHVVNNDTIAHDTNDTVQTPEPRRQSSFWSAMFLIIALLAIGAAAFIGWRWIKGGVQEKHYENVDDVQIFNNYTVNDEDDLDGDTLTNGQEKEYGTDYNSLDTDKDGLSDSDEINEHKTDPLKLDTDGDSIDDGAEIALKLNPLSKETDGTPDNKRKFEISHQLEEGSLTVNGFANVANIYAQKVDTFKKGNNPGVVSELYEFFIEGKEFDSAKLELQYDEKLFSEDSKYTPEDLSIFQYMDDGSFKLVESKVDLENHIVSANLEHFSKYCIAVKPIVEKEVSSKVFIVLDNSGSMYPKELCETSEENDVDFKRVNFAKKLIETSDEKKIQFGLAKFTADYTELCSGFNNKKSSLYDKLDSIKTTEENFNGTHIAKSIIEACNNFSKDDLDHRKFIILLTDGETTEGQGWAGLFDNNEDDAIRAAKEKNVSVIVVGLGTNVDTTYCNKIANSTNGKFIFANNSTALDDVHEAINTVISNGHVDLDGNGKADHILIADSGFDMSKNAFSFDNYWVKTVFEDEEIGGQCHGMAVFAQRYYLGTLPQTAEQIFEYKYNIKGESVAGMPYSLKFVEFFGNGSEKYTLSKTNLKEYKLLEKLQSYDTDNIWDKYQYNSKDKTYLEFKPELKEYIKNNPILILHEKNKKDSVVTGKNKADGKEYKYQYWDSYSFNIDKGLSDKWDEDVKDAYQVLCAFNNLWAGQFKDEWYDSAKFSDDGFDKIVNWVNSGIIPVCGGEGHATNLTQIYRDINDPLKYTLVLYDNNDCDNAKVLTLKKTKYNKIALDYTAWTNDYKFEIFDTDNVYGKKDKVISVDFCVYTK